MSEKAVIISWNDKIGSAYALQNANVLFEFSSKESVLIYEGDEMKLSKKDYERALSLLDAIKE